MNNPGLVKSFEASAAIAGYRIVKFGGTDTEVSPAAAAADSLIGVSVGLVTASAAGQRLDVVLTGVTEVEYGGTIARGDLLTSDAIGRAVKAVAGNKVIGQAMVSGVVSDIGSLLLGRSIF